MNRNKFLIILIVIVGLGFLIAGFLQNKNDILVKPGLINKVVPTLESPIPTPTIAPPVTPKTYQFDSSTDLKSELNKVNPQVLDSDF